MIFARRHSNECAQEYTNGVIYSRVFHDALYELERRRRSGQVRITISNCAVSDLLFKLHRGP